MDNRTVTDIFLKLHKPVRKWISKKGVPLAEADDLAQEVFIRMLLYSPHTEIQHLAGYVFTVAANIISEWREKSRVCKPHNAEWLTDLIDEQEPLHIVEEESNGVAISQRVAHYLSVLTPRRRQAIILHHMEGMSYKEVARATGTTYRTVMRDIVRSHNHMRQVKAMKFKLSSIDKSIKIQVGDLQPRSVLLSGMEYAVINCLLGFKGQPVQRTVIENAMNFWRGTAPDLAEKSNVLEVMVRRIRSKTIESFIHTHRGTGYSIPHEIDVVEVAACDECNQRMGERTLIVAGMEKFVCNDCVPQEA